MDSNTKLYLDRAENEIDQARYYTKSPMIKIFKKNYLSLKRHRPSTAES